MAITDCTCIIYSPLIDTEVAHLINATELGMDSRSGRLPLVMIIIVLNV